MKVLPLLAKRYSATRTWLAVWAAATLLSAASSGAAEAQGRREVLTVTIHVTDNVNLPAAELADAEAHATIAFRAAGFDIVWSSEPWKPAVSHDADPLSFDVRLVVVPRQMAEKKCREEGLGDRALGVALNGSSEARGRIAYIFYDRIERAAERHRTPVVHGLGHIMAHEVGHLLMGVDSHSQAGLMQEHWDPRDSRTQTFTRIEVQQIHRRFAATLASADRKP